MPRVNTSTWGNRSHRFLGIRPIETPVNLGGKIPNQSRLQTCKPSTTNSNETTPTPISCRFQIRTCLPITIYYHVPTNHISPPQHIPIIPSMCFQGPMTQNMVKITIRRISTPKYSVRKITLRYQTPTCNQWPLMWLVQWKAGGGGP